MTINDNPGNRTWKDNAAEFAALTKQGVDVRLAVLVATSIKQDAGHGRPPKNVSIETFSSKVSASKFAESAGTTNDRVLRHLQAWNRAAEAGLCSPSSDLTPADATDPELLVPSQEDFASYYDASKSGGRQYGDPTTAARMIETRAGMGKVSEIVEKLDLETRAALAKEAVRQADPITRVEIAKTVDIPHTDFTERRRVAQAEEHARKAERHSIRTLSIVVAIENARTRLRSSLDELRDVQFTDEERAHIKAELDHLKTVTNLVEMAIVGTTDVDWDAELARLGGDL